MDAASAALAELDEAMLAWFPPGSRVEDLKSLSESDLNVISELLQRYGQPSWSRVPRIYSVLYSINYTHVIDVFLENELTDLSFPFTQKTLPSAFQSQKTRCDFLNAQVIVLSNALALEKENGQHQHFGDQADVPFRTLAELGEGVDSRVDKVRSTVSYKEYARKILFRGRTFHGDRKVLQKFENELGALKKLSHEHIVKFIGSYTDPRFVAIIMSPVADYNLKQFFDVAFDSKDLRSLLRTFYGCLATALRYLHENSIRHKDIKPQNILVKSDHVYLSDFGLSLDWSDQSKSTSNGPSSGTPRYSAPEVAADQSRGSSSDIWSLGCVFLEMCTMLCDRTIKDLESYMKSNGSNSALYHANSAAMSSWMENLQSEESFDARVAHAWILPMLKDNADDRCTAQQLDDEIQKISSSSKFSLSFIGRCCIEDYYASEKSLPSSSGRIYPKTAEQSNPSKREFEATSLSASSLRHESRFNHPHALSISNIQREISPEERGHEVAISTSGIVSRYSKERSLSDPSHDMRRSEAETIIRNYDPDMVTEPRFPRINVTNLIAAHYTKRTSLFNDLSQTLDSSANDGGIRKVLLYGLAGSGKTQVARQYAKAYLSHHKNCYWFDASSLDILMNNFKTFAISVGLAYPVVEKASFEDRSPVLDQFSQSIAQQVIQYLEKFQEGWLLIYDNYDLSENEKDRFKLSHFFPDNPNGRIIVTSRNRDIEDDIRATSIHVHTLSDEEAIELLVKSANLPQRTEAEEVEDLKRSVSIELLGSIPLAIAQGGAFIKQRLRRGETLQRLGEYKQLFVRHKGKMLRAEPGYQALAQPYGKPIIKSWDMAFEVVLEDNPVAAQLLLFLGFLHHSNIPEEFFRIAHNNKAMLNSHDDIKTQQNPYKWVEEILATSRLGQWDNAFFHTCVSVLESFSLVQISEDSEYHIHPLVHTWTKIRSTEDHESMKARARLALAMLAKLFRHDLDPYSVEMRVIHTRFSSHHLSCVSAIQQYTNLLDPHQTSDLRAISLLRVANNIDNDLLSPDQRAQGLVKRLTLLALISGAQQAKLDDISTLKSLRNVLVHLCDYSPSYTSVVDPLAVILSDFLPIAASNDANVDLVKQKVYVLFLRLKASRHLPTPKIKERMEEILTFLEIHQSEIERHEYLRLRAKVLTSMVTTIDQQESKVLGLLARLQHLIPDLERHLKTSESHHTLLAKWAIGVCLVKLDNVKDAVEYLQTALDSAKSSPDVSTLGILQITYALNHLLEAQSEWEKMVENSKYLRTLVMERRGSFHQEALRAKRKVLEYERKLQLNKDESRPDGRVNSNVFGQDHCPELPDDLITLTIELAIAYKILEQENEIEPLWDGAMNQARDEKEAEDLISLNVDAFRICSQGARKQGYKDCSLLFDTAATNLQKIHTESQMQQQETRPQQLQRLHMLWEKLASILESWKTSSKINSMMEITTIIKNAPKPSKPALLFLTNHFLEWASMLDLSQATIPTALPTLEDLYSLSTEVFGPWSRSNNTVRALCNLISFHRLSSHHVSRAVDLENELIQAHIKEVHGPPQLQPGSGTRSLMSATSGIEQVHQMYKRRKWHAASLRLHEIAYNNFHVTLGLGSEATAAQFNSLCELYGRTALWQTLDAVLDDLSRHFLTSTSTSASDNAPTKLVVVQTIAAACQWCYDAGVHESSWYLLDWFYRNNAKLDGFTWALPLLQVAERVAQTNRPNILADIRSDMERAEFIVNMGRSLASISVPPSGGAARLRQDQVDSRIRSICDAFLRGGMVGALM